jgi:acyl-CoA synthetase (AMP-forming)/AMP-acid ligase II
MVLDLTPGALVEPVTGRRWERDEIMRQGAARARRYRRQGMKAGDRVSVHFGNRLEFFAELLAVWRLGGCVIPVDGRLTAFEVDGLTRAAMPRFAVVDDETDAAVTGCMSAAGVSVVNTLETGRGIDESLGTAPWGPARLDDDALILFTSGSTGNPKGVVHTHRSLRARWITLRQSLGLADFRRTLCLLPTHFGHGLICNCLFPWLSGQDLFVTPPFKPEILMRLGALIDEHAITFLSSVPSMWRMALKLARRPGQGTLARVHCGSAPLSARLWEAIQAWAGTTRVHNAYGITETGSWVAGTTVPDFTPEDGLIGEPWGAVVKILGTRDTARPPGPDMECAVGEAGLVWLNTPALMKGYLDRNDLTDRVVSHGWFMTGDIGVLDERGLLYLRDRERDEINKGGVKIYPADVDAVVERFDHATDVCTFALDDPVYGQNVGMAVVLSDASDAAIAALYGWMRRHLAEAKMPARWYLVDAIPHTSRGKINRDRVKEACAQLVPLDLTTILNPRKRPSGG